MNISSLGKRYPLRGPAQAPALAKTNSSISSASERPEASLVRRQVPGSYIAIASSDRLDSPLSDSDIEIERVLGTAGDNTFVLIQQTEKSPQQMQDSGDFLKVMPNYEYRGARYDRPVSEEPGVHTSSERPSHLDIINIDPAWEKTKGSPAFQPFGQPQRNKHGKPRGYGRRPSCAERQSGVESGAPKEVRLLTNEIGFDVSKLPPDSYRLVASANHLKDPFGKALDGNGDGVGGDDFVVNFQIGGVIASNPS